MKECLFNEFFGPTSVWAKELPRITGGVWGGEAPPRGGPGGAKPPRRGVKGAWPPSALPLGYGLDKNILALND